MSSPALGPGRRSPAEAHAAIERFLKTSRQPILLEPGEDHFTLEAGSFLMDWNNGRLTLQVWDRRRNLVRRVMGLHEEKPGRLELIIEKFPKREGRLLLIDMARPALAGAPVRGRRLSFRERFRRMLHRQFPDWRIAELSTEQDLEHSLSPLYPRALVRRGQTGLAAIAAPPEGADVLEARGAHDQRRKDQRHDDHADEPDERGPHGFDVNPHEAGESEAVGDEAKEGAEHQGDEDLRIEL